MKKIFLLFAFATTFGFTTQAQVSIIPKAGLSLADMALGSANKDSKATQKSTTGFLAGVGFNIPLDADGFFSIQPELLYIQKGFASEKNATNNGVQMAQNTKLQINYLEIPLLAKIAFGSESIKGYVNAGPSLGYGMGGTFNVKETASGFGMSSTEERNRTVKFGKAPANYDEEKEIYFDNRIDLGLQFGGGVAFKAGPGSLILDVRYGLGLSSIDDAPNPIPAGKSSSDYKAQNRVIAVSLGYAIPLGGK